MKKGHRMKPWYSWKKIWHLKYDSECAFISMSEKLKAIKQWNFPTFQKWNRFSNNHFASWTVIFSRNSYLKHIIYLFAFITWQREFLSLIIHREHGFSINLSMFQLIIINPYKFVLKKNFQSRSIEYVSTQFNMY